VLLLETVTSLAALRPAVEAVRRQSELPLLCTFSFAEDGTLDGVPPGEVARQVQALELAGFGYGCGFGLEASRPVLAELRDAAPEAVLIAKPSLGLPRDGVYDVSPEQAAAWAADMAELGIQVIGACCGSTPAHTAAIARTLLDHC